MFLYPILKFNLFLWTLFFSFAEANDLTDAAEVYVDESEGSQESKGYHEMSKEELKQDRKDNGTTKQAQKVAQLEKHVTQMMGHVIIAMVEKGQKGPTMLGWLGSRLLFWRRHDNDR